MLCLFLVLGAGVVRVSEAGLSLQAGAGMEFLGTNYQMIFSPDHFQTTLLQTTLALASITLAEERWEVEVSGAWSNWNASGEWETTGQPAYSTEPFFFADQRQVSIQVRTRIWGAWDLGADFHNYAVRHYSEAAEFLAYEDNRAGVRLFFTPWKNESVRIQLEGACLPWAVMRLTQQVWTDHSTAVLQPFFLEGRGAGGEAAVRLDYQDAAGWGLGIRYAFGWLAFPDLGGGSLLRKEGILAGVLTWRW